jgi:glutaredoxin
MDQQNPNATPWTNDATPGSTTTGTGGIGVTSAAEEAVCPHCGASKNRDNGLEQFLGRLGISDEMVNDLKSQFKDVDIDEYINTAREYLKDSSNKATSYAREHPGQVAAGFAALAVGAGLIYATVGRNR